MIYSSQVVMTLIDNAFDVGAIWKWTFAWLPHKCELSGKTIWLKYAYQGKLFFGNDKKPLDVRWRTTDEHLLYLLKE